MLVRWGFFVVLGFMGGRGYGIFVIGLGFFIRFFIGVYFRVEWFFEGSYLEVGLGIVGVLGVRLGFV